VSAASQSMPLVLPADELLIVTPCSARPGTVVITVSGEVDMSTGPLLKDRLHEQVHRSGPDLVVDLTSVRYFGVAGLTVLMDVRRVTVSAEIRFRVVAATRVVLLPLRLTGLDTVFDIYPDLSQALRPSASARHR
jgi:anti-anti-sigma factor